MSRLIDINLQIPLEPEPKGYEFGYYTFDLLPTLEVTNVELLKMYDWRQKIKILPIMIFGN